MASPGTGPAIPFASGKHASGFIDRLRAASIHLALSALVAALVAALVFVYWYPMPYRIVSGGQELFWLVIAVDVVLGPLITFAVFDRRKPWAGLRRDLAVVAALQLAGLGYGLYTVEQARPAVLALERDRIRVVRSIDLTQDDFAEAPAGLKQRSWLGPLRIATRTPDSSEMLDAIQMGLAGVDVGSRPKFWLAPEATAAAWAAAGLPLDDLRQMHPGRASELAEAVAATGLAEAQLRYLPILARRHDHVLLIDAKDGLPVGHAAFNGHR